MRDGDLFQRTWREARRRRLPTVLVAYPAAAWFAIEAVPDVLRNLGIDAETAAKVGSGITIVALAAFPLVLLLTWMFQVVPHAEAPEPQPHGGRFHRLFLGSSVVLVCAGCVTLATVLWPPVSAADVPDRAWWESRPLETDALALLPPRVLMGDERTGEIAACVVRRLTDRLAGVPGLQVRGPAETEWLAVEGLPPDSLSARLGVGTLITSTAEALDDGLRLTFRILDGSGRQLESVSVEGSDPSDHPTFESVAGELEVGIREALGRIRGRELSADRPGAPQAQEPFARAREEQEFAARHLQAGDLDAAMASLQRADALMARAAEADGAWADPLAERARIGHQRALLLLTNDRAAAVAAGRASLDNAAEALTRAPGHPEALRLRGLAAYDVAVLSSPGAAERSALLAEADAYLRRSQSRHRDRAEVRYLLSLVKREQGNLTEALTFARDAYEHDSYLSLSDRVLLQLFDLSFQLSRDGEATAWCEEGRRRFPGEWGFAACRLTLMGWGILPADTASAHALVEEALQAYPPAFRGVLRPNLETLAAAVHVQAGDAEGARGILTLTTLAPPPAVLVTAAGVWLLLGEEEQALDHLRRYVAVAPGEARHLLRMRPLEPLRDDPRFGALAGVAP